jgi:methionine-rich copper-binding protein CopC
MSKNILPALVLAFAAGSLITAGPAFGHAALKSSAPKNGATTAAPKTLDLEFEHPARLTKIKLTTGDKEIPVVVDTTAPAAKSFSVPLPALAPGKYDAKWATLGADGHAMTGTLSFTVTGK